MLSRLFLFSLSLSLSLSQYEHLATHYKYVTIIVYIVMFLVEASRLYLGYEGNLREKVWSPWHRLL